MYFVHYQGTESAEKEDSKMKELRNYGEKTYLAGLYSPAKRRFLQQSPEDLTIGGRLRRERILRKLTIEQMATYLNISACYLGSIERGQRPVSKKLQNLLHEKLGLSYDFLIEGMPVTSSMISQYVRETGHYTTRHNIEVLLNVCDEEELEDSYDLVHTFLTRKRTAERKAQNRREAERRALEQQEAERKAKEEEEARKKAEEEAAAQGAPEESEQKTQAPEAPESEESES